MNPYQKLLEQIHRIESRMGYVFKNKEILALAFVHRSFFNENRKEVLEHNERLEFLGDSILGLLISEYLYSQFPEEAEGRLSHLKSSLVEAAMCAKFVKKVSLVEFVLLGKGEGRNDGKGKESIQADLFEALLAAIYLDGGLEAVKVFFWSHFTPEIESFLKNPLRNWKADLQDYFQKNHQKLPSYRLLSEQGPEHSKTFEIGVFLDEKLLGKGIGPSKKEAEQFAAQEALLLIEEKKDG